MEANIDSYDIALERVSFAYGKEPVLTDVDLKLPAGSVTALVGPSGSGKTTIARLIASQWDAKEGNIAVGGVRMENIPLSQLNDMVAFVTQDNFLFNETVMENIRCGRKDATDEMVMDIAVKSNCDTFIRKLEHGYQTVCGSGGGHLSGGEKQRISIARAMLKDAPIIILDEATSYTDPESEADIQQAVSGLVQGKTLIVIAHRLSTIIHSDKIAVINEGRVEAEGTHEELLAQCRLYKDMWEAHVSSRETDIRGAQENV
jgi:ATP-binding cassette subfamily B protein